MKYRITIRLIHECNLLFNVQFPYFNSHGKKDDVAFGRHEIIILSERKHSYIENDVFMNVQNTLYNQVLKCLQIHYCYCGAKAGISSILIERAVGKRYCLLCERLFDLESQPYPSFDPPLKFKVDPLKLLLNEDNDSYYLRNIISHWLSQGLTSDRQRKLECIWRTFERLCDYKRHAPIGERSKIADGLDIMVNELITHSISYHHTASLMSSETLESLRHFRWREMIENNYSKTTGNKNLKSLYNNYIKRLITPYIDERVCTLMKDVLVYRRNELRKYSLYSGVVLDLNTKIQMRINRDIDVVAILCYYAYYLRNRLFHGQSLVRASIFDNNKNDEMYIDRISTMLSFLTIELINNYPAL